MPAALTSQLVVGMRIEILGEQDRWLQVRGEDGYEGWTHRGYLAEGDVEWATAWERGAGGEAVVSLGAELVDAEGQARLRAPWGGRLIRSTPLEFLLPDGVTARLESGEVVDLDRLQDRFPTRADSLVRTARRWLGSPYLWGGITRTGADCSGFAQAVCWMHGIALPRDSRQQARIGTPVEGDEDAWRAGDLLFFAEYDDRISHVAICTGGTQIIHAAVTNGAVSTNDLAGTQPLEVRLRNAFVGARRLFRD
jgi:gamma-D-glutamyl-L-lysine dipeptidyl-peptidase